MDIFFNPKMKEIEVGTDKWFAAQQQMIFSKPLVKRCYDIWYAKLAQDVASVPGDGCVLELGSGAGYIKKYIPYAITSDVTAGVADIVVDGRGLPFPDRSMRALLLTHVFHHIPNVKAFFLEASRVLVPGGVISMIECTNTLLGRLFFDKVHPEPYRPNVRDWSFEASDSMHDSNQALSWIVFKRDIDVFKSEFPEFSFEGGNYLPWLSYLLSGGVNLRSLVPGFASPIFEWFDDVLKPLDRFGAIHWHLTVRKGI